MLRIGTAATRRLDRGSTVVVPTTIDDNQGSDQIGPSSQGDVQEEEEENTSDWKSHPDQTKKGSRTTTTDQMPHDDSTSTAERPHQFRLPSQESLSFLWSHG